MAENKELVPLEDLDKIYSFLYDNVNFINNVIYEFDNYATTKDRKNLYAKVKNELDKIGLKSNVLEKISLYYTLKSYDNSIKDYFTKMIDLLNNLPENLVLWADKIEPELYTSGLELRFIKIFNKFKITLQLIYDIIEPTENKEDNNNKNIFNLNRAQVIIHENEWGNNYYFNLIKDGELKDKKNTNTILELAFITDRLIP